MTTKKRKLRHSEYIENVKPTAKKLVDLLTREYGYASVLCVDAEGKNYRTDKSGVSVSDEPLYCSRGFVLRVVVHGSVLEHSFSSLCEEDLPCICEHVRSLASDMPEGNFVVSDEECTLCESSEYEISPEEVGDEWILSRLGDARTSAIESDERVFDALCRCSWQRYTKLFLSPKRDMTESIMWATSTILTFTKSGDRIKDSYQGYSNLGGVEVISRMAEEGVPTSVAHAIELLDSCAITPGEYDCICSPDVCGIIVHEAFGHGVEMDMFVRDRALAREYIGKRVASDLVSMHDSATAVEEAASYFFDDEGNLATDTKIIDRGILLGGISDAQTAAVLSLTPTGNGRRESFSHKAYTRMTNTYFEEGEDKLDDMIASIDYGFYLDEARCGMEDPKNWGIQCVVGIAREIKDGKLTGRVFSPAVLSGYVPDLLCSISMMSREGELRGTGFCGKGHKEWVKVSDGGPAIKARIKLS